MFERKHNFDINNEIFKSHAKSCVKAYSSSASFDLNVLTTVTMQPPPPPNPQQQQQQQQQINVGGYI